MSIQATINVTAAWLCKHKPVVFTNRSKDQPLLADPFPIFQQVVKDNKAFFRDMHGYVPLPNTKTGLAGVRSRVYTELWRDKVILEALRIYRARIHWAAIRSCVRMRSIAVYWQAQTAHLYAAGGVGRKRDREAFEGEFVGYSS